MFGENNICAIINQKKSSYATVHAYNFISPKKRLYNSHKKIFLSWIAKNGDFLTKNQHFPQNERLRFHKNWFQTKEASSPKKYSVCLVSIFQRVMSIMR